MAVLLIKAKDNDLAENMPGKWRRGHVVDARDWDTNPHAPSGTKECPPHFELVTVPGVSAEEAVRMFCGPMCSGFEMCCFDVVEDGKMVRKVEENTRIIRRCCWTFNFDTKCLYCHVDGREVHCNDVCKCREELCECADERRAAKLQG